MRMWLACRALLLACDDNCVRFSYATSDEILEKALLAVGKSLNVFATETKKPAQIGRLLLLPGICTSNPARKIYAFAYKIVSVKPQDECAKCILYSGTRLLNRLNFKKILWLMVEAK